VVSVDWRVFSLEVKNTGKTSLEDALEFRGAPALRTAVALRSALGADRVGTFYRALGARTWDSTEDIRDLDVLRASVKDIDEDPTIVDTAINDPATWALVLAEHQSCADEVGGFGVPTIRLDGGRGPGIFGPVIDTLPADAEAVELWKHVSWLMRNDHFWEVKRERTASPDLEHVRVRAARRAQRDAEK
jgi:hypothetical protein